MAKKKTLKRPPRPGLEDQMLTKVAKFLETKGWKVVVIGGTRVQQWPGDGYRYEFVVGFTGAKRPS
jgi:hypothetical protein